MSTFSELQNGFYNALTVGLGFSPQDPFQVIQPSPPLISGPNADQLLWNYFNNIPPLSLTQNTILSGGNQFLANYQGVMSALQASSNNFRRTVGDDCFKAYQQAIEQNKVVPGDPVAFRNWAMFSTYCSNVAVTGASALAQDLLDPIFAGQMNVLGYRPSGTKDVYFVPDYKQMLEMLKTAPSRSFNVKQGTWNSDVSKTWTSGANSGFFGLWGGSSSSSSISEKFAASGVSVDASFGNVLLFSATPGNWYSSAALGLAFHYQTGGPWNPSSFINWQSTFGPRGNLQRFTTSLIVVNRMNVTVKSYATYSALEQNEINANKKEGLWPFYTNESASGSYTKTAFDEENRLTISIHSDPDVPIVIGCTILPAAQYLGHETQRAEILAASYR